MELIFGPFCLAHTPPPHSRGGGVLGPQKTQYLCDFPPAAGAQMADQIVTLFGIHADRKERKMAERYFSPNGEW